MPDDAPTVGTALPSEPGTANQTDALRRWGGGILVAIVLWWLVGRRGEVESVARTLASGQWEWIFLAMLVQSAGLACSAANYRQAFDIVGIKVRWRDMLPVLLSSLVLGEVAPLGWAAGSAVFIRFALRRGHSASQAAIGTLLGQAADLLSFSLAFLIGAAIAAAGHERPTSAEMSGIALLIAMNITLFGGLALAVGRPVVLLRLESSVHRIAKRIDRVNFRPFLPENPALAGLVTAGEAVRKEPHRLLLSLAMAAVANLSSLSCLYLCFLAFGQPASFGQIVIGYGTGTIAWIVSPVPAGLGVVEGATALALASMGVSATRAAVIAVAYRGVSFWLPFVAGLLSLHRQAISDRILREE